MLCFSATAPLTRSDIALSWNYFFFKFTCRYLGIRFWLVLYFMDMCATKICCLLSRLINSLFFFKQRKLCVWYLAHFFLIGSQFFFKKGFELCSYWNTTHHVSLLTETVSHLIATNWKFRALSLQSCGTVSSLVGQRIPQHIPQVTDLTLFSAKANFLCEYVWAKVFSALWGEECRYFHTRLLFLNAQFPAATSRLADLLLDLRLVCEQSMRTWPFLEGLRWRATDNEYVILMYTITEANLNVDYSHLPLRGCERNGM